MPPGRKETNGRSASVSASLKPQHMKDPGAPPSGKLGSTSSTSSSKMSTSDHLIPIAPRSLPSIHDARLTYRPVLRQTNQQTMYQYHGMGGTGLPLHAPPSSPYQAYYPRTMMLPSSGSSSDPMIPSHTYSTGTDVHSQVPVGVSHNTYAYPMPPWHAPTGTSRKRKSARAPQMAEKLQSPDNENSADESDYVNGRAEKRKERHKVTAPKSADSAADSTDGDPFPPLTIANVDRSSSSSREKLSENEGQMHSSVSVGSPAVSDDDDKSHTESAPGGAAQGTQAMSDDNSHQDRASPETPEEGGYQHPRPCDMRRFPAGVSKKAYSQSLSHVPVDVDKAIEPLSAFNAPLGLEMASELSHYKKTVALLHERLKKEHDHGRQASLQRIRAEMMWEAVAQELRQLRVHLARLATQPLPTAMSGGMQMP